MQINIQQTEKKDKRVLTLMIFFTKKTLDFKKGGGGV